MKPYYSEKGITIYNADCREILPSLPKVDLVLTDPPYNVAKDYGNSSSDSLPVHEWAKFMSEVFAATYELSEDGSHMLATFPLKNLPLALRTVEKYEWKWPLFWHKSNAMLFSPAGVCRMDLAGWWTKGGAEMPHKASDTYVKALIPQPESEGHPCPKSISFFGWLMARFDSRLVLDPFMGSGTTLRAAKDLGRQAIGIEIEERYCEIAANRLRQEVLNFEAVA